MMEPIEYDTRRVPSWSWMAYHSGIQYMDIPFGKVDWIDNLRFDKERQHALITDVGGFRDCRTEQEVEQEGKHYAVLDFGRIKRGWILYDVEEREDLCKEYCVVVGKKSKKDNDKMEGGNRLNIQEYYILVVRPTSVVDEYRRVGVGLIKSDYVPRQRLNVRVV
ncbi:hypothetical protein K469DRAFT_694871 [Zopfia rhizophila CBS 207.26]|uniref:Heterokaryon incompatibility domain-containing protein n=1 Tax=Zopfia rhizophila CBS 207.26 TaxID=1314779 RepID=A0A6A6DL64_9PEZI|nr:hypothetical protein K469DRAFT_694871 [Zopfia rhizophila CBS 207.26]